MAWEKMAKSVFWDYKKIARVLVVFGTFGHQHQCQVFLWNLKAQSSGWFYIYKYIYIYVLGIDFSALTTRTPCVMGLEAMAKFQQEQTAVNSRHVASARVFTLRPDGFAFFCALQVVPPLDRDPFPSCQVCASW